MVDVKLEIREKKKFDEGNAYDKTIHLRYPHRLPFSLLLVHTCNDFEWIWKLEIQHVQSLFTCLLSACYMLVECLLRASLVLVMCSLSARLVLSTCLLSAFYVLVECLLRVHWVFVKCSLSVCYVLAFFRACYIGVNQNEGQVIGFWA